MKSLRTLLAWAKPYIAAMSPSAKGQQFSFFSSPEGELSFPGYKSALPNAVFVADRDVIVISRFRVPTREMFKAHFEGNLRTLVVPPLPIIENKFKECLAKLPPRVLYDLTVNLDSVLNAHFSFADAGDEHLSVRRGVLSTTAASVFHDRLKGSSGYFQVRKRDDSHYFWEICDLMCAGDFAGAKELWGANSSFRLDDNILFYGPSLYRHSARALMLGVKSLLQAQPLLKDRLYDSSEKMCSNLCLDYVVNLAQQSEQQARERRHAYECLEKRYYDALRALQMVAVRVDKQELRFHHRVSLEKKLGVPLPKVRELAWKNFPLPPSPSTLWYGDNTVN